MAPRQLAALEQKRARIQARFEARFDKAIESIDQQMSKIIMVHNKKVEVLAKQLDRKLKPLRLKRDVLAKRMSKQGLRGHVQDTRRSFG